MPCGRGLRCSLVFVYLSRDHRTSALIDPPAAPAVVTGTAASAPGSGRRHGVGGVGPRRRRAQDRDRERAATAVAAVHPPSAAVQTSHQSRRRRRREATLSMHAVPLPLHDASPSFVAVSSDVSNTVCARTRTRLVLQTSRPQETSTQRTLPQCTLSGKTVLILRLRQLRNFDIRRTTTCRDYDQDSRTTTLVKLPSGVVEMGGLVGRTRTLPRCELVSK